MHVAVFGLGYVGCVSAACLAKLGHKVSGIDTDAFKVELVNRGKAPFHEPGLEDLLAAGIQAGLLSASTAIGDTLRDADVAMICVGTPSDKATGNLDLTYLRRVAGQIAAAPRSPRLIVSIRSTVFPGVNESIHHEIFGLDPGIRMAANPEFLREGCAVSDFLEPSLIVVGAGDPAAAATVAEIYAALPCPVRRTSLRAAEMIKYACNAYHAVKIGFANEIGSLAHSLGIDGAEVMSVLCEDRKLNASAAYLRPGFAFGGSCLPKDLRALSYRARSAALTLPLLESVLPSNAAHLDRLAARVRQLPSARLGVFGLAFKEDTDDLRESPAIQLVESLLAQGRALRIFDAQIDLEKIHGANQRFLLEHLPHIHRLMAPAWEEWLSWSEALVIAQKPSAAFRERLFGSGKPVLDLTT
jgi:GDP-mannose 6-dehydrogenase